jgi:phosphoglycerate dehydrogenase-like enzyme
MAQPARPRLAFAYDPARTERVFSAGDVVRLREVADIVRDEPLLRLDTDEARAAIADIDVLVTGWGAPAVDATTLVAAPKLRLIAHSAGTVKSFIDRAVFEAGVQVITAAAANAVPVAEFTLAAILFANKRVFEFRELYRRTRTRDGLGPIMASAFGNYHNVIGVIGASRIGLKLIEMLRPCEFRVLLHAPRMSAEEARGLGVELVELDDLLGRSDVVTLHAASIPETRHMLSAREFALMRDGATFINTARGAIVDHAAMERELISGRISAVLDVTEPEPLPAVSPLYELPNVLLLPHIAGAAGIERERLGALVVDEVVRFARGEPLQHLIDFSRFDRLA